VKNSIKKNSSARGSILILAVLIFMLIASLSLFIIANILSKEKESLEYLNKIKIHYLAEGANAIARSYLIGEDSFSQWKNINKERIENFFLSYRITPLDNYLWKIESAAEDISKKSKVEIINIVRPEFDYVLFSPVLISEIPVNKLSILGNIYTEEFNSQKQRNSNLQLPFLDESFYENLPNSSSTSIGTNSSKILQASNSKKEIKGIFILHENLKARDIRLNGSIIAIKGNIEINGDSEIRAIKKYPSLLSFNGDIIISSKKGKILINGLVYANNVYINGNIKIKGAVFAKNKIIIKKSGEQEINLSFDESILQTQGLHLRWKKLKNLTWEIRDEEL